MSEVDKEPDEEPIPKLPRAKLFGKPSGAVLIRMGMFGTMLYALIMMREPCATGAARFVGQFSEVDAGPVQTGISKQYPGFQIVTAEEALQMLKDAQPDAGTSGDADTASDAGAKPDAGDAGPKSSAGDADVTTQ
ncbi:MAG: hypothetical protein JKY56_11125 [Kofleriaceae bacterium]|nr:hypothetical protein [Kofleriaceae bacterium]